MNVPLEVWAREEIRPSKCERWGEPIQRWCKSSWHYHPPSSFSLGTLKQPASHLCWDPVPNWRSPLSPITLTLGWLITTRGLTSALSPPRPAEHATNDTNDHFADPDICHQPESARRQRLCRDKCESDLRRGLRAPPPGVAVPMTGEPSHHSAVHDKSRVPVSPKPPSLPRAPLVSTAPPNPSSTPTTQGSMSFIGASIQTLNVFCPYP